MTAAERKARERENKKAKQEDAERRNLVAELMRIYKRQQSAVVSNTKTPEATAERQCIARVQRRRYRAGLEELPVVELRSALKVQQETVDSHGRLHNERSGGRSYSIEDLFNKAQAAGAFTVDGDPDPVLACPVRPEGAGPGGDESCDDDKDVRTGSGGFEKPTGSQFDDLLDKFVREHMRDLDKEFQDIKRLCDGCDGEEFQEIKRLFRAVVKHFQCDLCGWVTTWFKDSKGHFMVEHNARFVVEQQLR